MSCSSPGATHHLACDCREREWAERLAGADRALFAERERVVRAELRAASLSRELLDAMRARDSYRASAELRVGMRREFEELLNVGDTTAPETFEAGLVRLRALLAAESRAERLAEALREVMEWIAAWDPRFVTDPEWDATQAKVDAALAEEWK